MKLDVQKLWSNRSTRVLILLFIVLLILIVYFLSHSYFVQLNIHKQKVLSRLDAIANTTAVQIEGDVLESILNTYTEIDAIAKNDQDSDYHRLQLLLSEVKRENQLSSEIYTLSLNEEKKAFYFGISSAEKPFYRHVYDHFPPELMENYELGGSIGVYEDMNGFWLSAFVPIRNSKGEVIAVIQADQLFDAFIEEARSDILVNIIISLIITAVLVFILVRSVRSILLAEDKMTNELKRSKQELEQKNRDITDSIHYAKKIQEAILPDIKRLNALLPHSFVLFLPRDIVSGDFYWFKKVDETIIVAAVDCTGHGVPGAFMSMVGSVLLEDIVGKQGVLKPCAILDQLHEKVVESLKQNKVGNNSKDGMDIAICTINVNKRTLFYAGACRPLVIIRDGEIVKIKGDACPIGGTDYQSTSYCAHEVKIEAEDSFYIFSDGFQDQFGGERNKKYMTTRLRKYISSISKLPMAEQKDRLQLEFTTWKGENEQVDDVLIIGFKL